MREGDLLAVAAHRIVDQENPIGRLTAMVLYIISCALRDPAHDYAPLWQAFEHRGYRRAMEAVWIFESADDISSLTKSILPMLRDDDRLFVGEIGRWSATHLLTEAHEFLGAIAKRAKEQ